MFGRKKRMTPREVIAAAILHAKTPVCVCVQDEAQLADLARVCVAFLIDWRQRKLFLRAHHSGRLVFLDGRSIAEGEDHSAFFSALREPGVHGCIITHVSDKFLKQCRKIGRFVWVALDDALSSEALPQTIDALLEKGPLNPRGHSNVGVFVTISHRTLFPAFEQYARELPFIISCTASNWLMYPYLMQGMVTVALGMRLVVLPAPSAKGSDGWQDDFATAAKHLADTLQGAIASTPAIS